MTALRATVRDHCYGCGKVNHERDHCTSGLAVRPTRLSRHGWSSTITVTNIQPCVSISVPMELRWPSRQRERRIEYLTESDRTTDLRKDSTKDAERRVQSVCAASRWAIVTAATFFDTGAHTSFVNREIAKWIELQAEGIQSESFPDLRRIQRRYR